MQLPPSTGESATGELKQMLRRMRALVDEIFPNKDLQWAEIQPQKAKVSTAIN
jgi:hypothetical protein